MPTRCSSWFATTGVAVHLLLVAAAPAATITVTKTADTDGECTPLDCSLREAAAEASSSGTVDLIYLPAGVYPLALGPVQIDTDLKIQGEDAGVTVLDGGDLDQVLVVGGEAALDVEDLALQAGLAHSGDRRGGCIYTAGPLTLTRVHVRNCVADEGGGGVFAGGDLTVQDSRFEQNLSKGLDDELFECGGGIFAYGGALSVSGSTFVDNQAEWGGDQTGFGGGLCARDTRATSVTTSSFIRNDALEGGGAYIHAAMSEEVSVSTSSFSSNTAGGGGGLSIAGPVGVVEGSTFNRNVAAVGGGLYCWSGTTCTNCRFDGNSAWRPEGGGGLYCPGGVLVASVLLRNHATGGSGGGGSVQTASGGLVLYNTAAGNCGGLVARLRAEQIEVRGNQAGGDGGGLCAREAIDVVAWGNSAGGRGGGIVALELGEPVIRRAQVGQNFAAGGGGGVFGRAALVIEDSLIAENETSAQGGGVLSESSLTVERSLVHANKALDPVAGIGGGVSIASGLLDVVNSTVFANQASILGGGILAFASDVAISNSTISANAAASGEAVGNSGSSVSVVNTILDGACGGTGLTSAGHNIESPGSTCGLDAVGDQIAVSDVGLQPLAWNGGYTRTLALGGLSPAINTGDDVACEAVDQRGFARGGDVCDVGAFEVGAPAAACVDSDADGWGRPGSALCTNVEPDCDDEASAVNPGAAEIPGNGLDDDCHPGTPDFELDIFDDGFEDGGFGGWSAVVGAL